MELHLKLAGSAVPGIVLIQRVVDDHRVIGAAALLVVSSDRDAGGVTGINRIIARDDVAGGLVRLSKLPCLVI